MRYVRAISDSYRTGGMSGVLSVLKTKAWTLRNSIRRTEFPLKTKFKNQIYRSLEDSREKPAGTLIKKTAADFPSAEELVCLWPIVYSQQRTLYGKQTRHGDLCPDITLSYISKGRIIQKNLFEIWLFLHEDPSIILEIGCRAGQSLINKMAFHTDPDNATVFCLDLFIEGGSKRTILDNLRYFGISTRNIFFFEGDSKQIIPSLINEFPELMFDYVLVDGSHHVDDAYQDLVNVIPLVRPGGYLVFDDTGPGESGDEGYGLLEVWDRAMSVYGSEFDKIHYDLPYGFCVARRLGNESVDFCS